MTSRPPPQIFPAQDLTRLQASLQEPPRRPAIDAARMNAARAGWQTLTYNLSNTSPKAIPGGVGVYLDPSSASDCQLSVRLGNNPVTLVPGTRVKTVFPGGVIESFQGTGQCRLIVFQDPDADISFFSLGGASTGVRRVADVTQAPSSTANVPTLDSQGVSIDGAQGLRCILNADLGNTITGGTLVLWLYDVTAGVWAESSVQDTPPTGRRAVAIADQLVGARTGRAYFEARSVTTSGGGIEVIMVAA